MSNHEEEIQKFIHDNKDAVSNVMNQITDRVHSGNLDFDNYKQEIEVLVNKPDLKILPRAVYPTRLMTPLILLRTKLPPMPTQQMKRPPS